MGDAEPLEQRSLSISFTFCASNSICANSLLCAKQVRVGQDLRTNSCFFFFPPLWSPFGPGELPDLVGSTLQQELSA